MKKFYNRHSVKKCTKKLCMCVLARLNTLHPVREMYQEGWYGPICFGTGIKQKWNRPIGTRTFRIKFSEGSGPPLKDAPQKMQSLGRSYNKKTGKSGPVAPKCKMAQTSAESTFTDPIYVWFLFFLHIPTAREQGQICTRGFMGIISSGKKFQRF